MTSVRKGERSPTFFSARPLFATLPRPMKLDILILLYRAGSAANEYNIDLTIWCMAGMHTPANLKSVVVQAWARPLVGVPLLHVCRLQKDELRAALSTGVAAVPPAARRDTNTLATEAALSIPASVYFFVGRCCPRRAGAITIAIRASDLARDEGTVSPFDTGGLHHNKLLLLWRDYAPNKRSYLQQHTAPMNGFEEYFTVFLSEFFRQARSYWNQPDQQIDGMRLTADHDWRNWTFEVRFEEHADVSNAKWYFSPEADSHYNDLVADGLIDPLPDSRYEVATRPFEKAEADAAAVAVV